MAKSKKRRKIIVFSLIAVGLAGLTTAAMLKKREAVITVQTEKVSRRDLIEKVVANGKIQPVLQVKISAEVSGELIELPVKEGQCVSKGDLLVKIKPEFYVAQLHQAEASFASAQAGKATAEANLRKAQADFKRADDLFKHHLISESDFDSIHASYDVAEAQRDSAIHQVEMSKASVDSAQESLDKTTIVSPLAGTISRLNSRLGERVLGTVQNIGTEIMTISDLNEMEARVDLGENDIVLIAGGQKASLEVDAFKGKKFTGIVTEIANSSNDSGLQGQSGSSSSSQEATKFQVRIRVQEKESFRPGMSVTAEIETRYRTNVLTVPIASVTSRLPKTEDKEKPGANRLASGATNSANSKASTNAPSATALAANSATEEGTNTAKADKKSKEAPKPIEVVFVVDGERAKTVPVKIGIGNDDYWEITDGLADGQEVVSGNYRAIRDLEDGKKIRKGPATPDKKEKKG
jgi:HlyD family secretion protein